MNDKKKSAVQGLIGLVLWAILLTILVNRLIGPLHWDFSGLLFKFLLWAMLMIVIFFCWWLFAGFRLNRFMKRLDEAGFAYLESHDVDTYLSELDACCEMPGVDKSVLSGIPARDYVTIMKIRVLLESGRSEEALALLQIAKQEMKSDKAQLLLKAEEEKLLEQTDSPHQG